MTKKDSTPKNHEDLVITESEERVVELTGDLQRIQAEFMNYKRRAEAERSEVLDFAKNRVVREFLNVRDSFDNELTHRPATVDPKWAASIDNIRAQFDQALKTLQVERFESQGHAFDPRLHDAITMEEGDGAHEVVTEELQPGYRIGEAIIRHAMVKVGRSDEVTSESPPGTKQQLDDNIEQVIDTNEGEE
jgi:molecular chaperone GrpE